MAVLIYRGVSTSWMCSSGRRPRSSTADRAVRETDGYNFSSGTQSGLTFWAVSDVNPDDLQRLAQLFRTAT